jgi:hypothetical protein
VYTVLVKNITLSADERLIEAAREQARAEHTTLNAAFRVWLEQYARPQCGSDDVKAVIRELQADVRTGGRRFTREQMNDRR